VDDSVQEALELDPRAGGVGAEVDAAVVVVVEVAAGPQPSGDLADDPAAVLHPDLSQGSVVLEDVVGVGGLAVPVRAAVPAPKLKVGTVDGAGATQARPERAQPRMGMSASRMVPGWRRARCATAAVSPPTPEG
jgi:hypothetical protein